MTIYCIVNYCLFDGATHKRSYQCILNLNGTSFLCSCFYSFIKYKNIHWIRNVFYIGCVFINNELRLKWEKSLKHKSVKNYTYRNRVWIHTLRIILMIIYSNIRYSVVQRRTNFDLFFIRSSLKTMNFQMTAIINFGSSLPKCTKPLPLKYIVNDFSKPKIIYTNKRIANKFRQSII